MNSSLIREICKACRNDSKLSFRMLSNVIFGLVASLLVPWPLKIMLDDVLRGQSAWKPGAIIGLSLLFFLLVWCRGYFNHYRHVHLTDWADKTAERLRLRLFSRILHARVAVLQNYSADDLRSRMGEDINRIRDSFVEAISSAFAEIFTLVGSLAILFYVDPRFATFGILVLMVLAFVYRYFPARIAEENDFVRDLEAKRSGVVGRALQERVLVKSWVQESAELERLTEAAEVYTSANLAKAHLEGKFIFSVEQITATVQALTLGYGAFRVSQGTLSIGDLVLFLQYLALMHAPIGRLCAFLVVFQRGAASWNRVQETLQLEIEAAGGGLLEKEPRGLRLEFRSVGFGYRRDHSLFQNLCFHARPGEVVALVGTSGIGKSTLLKLILGFYEPQAGEILMGGISLKQLDLKEARRQIAFIDQESRLFSASLLENLRYGNSQVDEAKMARVCRELRVDTFAASLPNGYATNVQADSANFSIGQRQRIALARALASDRALVLMDEPTSALDEALESELLEKLPQLLGEKTAILVTHRPAPLRIATQVVRLQSQATLKAVELFR